MTRDPILMGHLEVERLNTCGGGYILAAALQAAQLMKVDKTTRVSMMNLRPTFSRVIHLLLNQCTETCTLHRASPLPRRMAPTGGPVWRFASFTVLRIYVYAGVYSIFNPTGVVGGGGGVNHCGKSSGVFFRRK